jgi:ABC-type molybdate transport system substrate-binding protein
VFGGSRTLLANIAVTRRGDLYLPADESYLVIAREKNLIRASLPVAGQSAVVAVPRGNPKGIRSLAAIVEARLTLSQADPETETIGGLLGVSLLPSLWLALSNRTAVFKPNVSDAANDVKLGAVDAAIVWDSMRHQFPDLDLIQAPELASVRASVAVAVLSCSRQPQAAQKFAAYVASPQQGLRRFEGSGFTTHKNR